jgi:uncharacterized protein YjbJ (UPF0337 family)
MVDTNRITGAAREIGGKVQSALGDLTGSKHDSVEGRAREAQGAAENLYGQAKDTVHDAADRVAQTARDVGGKVRDAVDDLGSSNEVGERARQTRDAAEDYYSRAERSVRHAADAVYDSAEDAYENGGRYIRQGGRDVSHRVGEHPIAALLIAGLLGYGVGLLIHGRD